MTSNQQYKYYLKLDNQNYFDKVYPVYITKQLILTGNELINKNYYYAKCLF